MSISLILLLWTCGAVTVIAAIMSDDKDISLRKLAIYVFAAPVIIAICPFFVFSKEADSIIIWRRK